MAVPAREVTPQITPETTMAALHVVHLIEALGPGGAERLLYTNLKHFDPSRVRSTVFTVYSRANHWLEPIRDLGVPVFSLDANGPRDLPRAIKKFSGWLRANRPDVVHSHLWAANVIARVAGRFARVPVVSSVHNPDHEDVAWSDGAEVSLTKRRLVKGIDRWTARVGNERLIAVSEHVRQSANRHLKFSLDRIDLLYNPIDVATLTAAPLKDRSRLLSELDLPPDSVVLLNVARLAPQKGLIHALRALPKIIEKYPHAHLLSVGSTTDPVWLAEMKNEAAHLGVADHFHILGERRDVTDFLHACDVFVFPSLYEGLGIALIEAMAAGCACVATTAGPIPEFVENGREALLVPPADTAAIAVAVCELLADPDRCKQLAGHARRTALARFQPQAAADRLTEIYERVAKSRADASNGIMTTEVSHPPTSIVIEHFDKLSANRGWSQLYVVSDGKSYHFHVRRARVLELLPEKLGRVLDVGCGPGVMVNAVLERGGSFEGRDLSPEMVAESIEKFGHLPNVNFKEGDIENIDLPDASCDQVLAMAVIEYLSSPDKALSEISRVLKPGGVAVITIPKRRHIDKTVVSLATPFRVLARMAGMATGDLIPRLCLQPEELDRAAERAGMIPDGGSQYNFTPFPYPLTRLLPGLSMRLNTPFERWHETKSALKSFFAHGYVGRYRRAE